MLIPRQLRERRAGGPHKPYWLPNFDFQAVEPETESYDLIAGNTRITRTYDLRGPMTDKEIKSYGAEDLVASEPQSYPELWHEFKNSPSVQEWERKHPHIWMKSLEDEEALAIYNVGLPGLSEKNQKAFEAIMAAIKTNPPVDEEGSEIPEEVVRENLVPGAVVEMPSWQMDTLYWDEDGFLTKEVTDRPAGIPVDTYTDPVIPRVRFNLTPNYDVLKRQEEKDQELANELSHAGPWSEPDEDGDTEEDLMPAEVWKNYLQARRDEQFPDFRPRPIFEDFWAGGVRSVRFKGFEPRHRALEEPAKNIAEEFISAVGDFLEGCTDALFGGNGKHRG